MGILVVIALVVKDLLDLIDLDPPSKNQIPTDKDVVPTNKAINNINILSPNNSSFIMVSVGLIKKKGLAGLGDGVFLRLLL